MYAVDSGEKQSPSQGFLSRLKTTKVNNSKRSHFKTTNYQVITNHDNDKIKVPRIHTRQKQLHPCNV